MTTTRSKFNVSSDTSKRTYDGIVFDSIMEKRFYEEVVLPDYQSGKIASFILQKKYILQPCRGTIRAITYIADFQLTYPDGTEEVIDIKGNVDSIFSLKKKMLLFHYPDINFRCIAYSKIDGGWVDREYIIQQRKKRKKEKAEKSAMKK